MRFDVRVIKTLIQIVESEIDICSEFFKPLVHVGGEVVEAFVHGCETFVDVGGEVVEALIDRIEAFGHSFEANIHGVLEPVDLRLDVHEPSACFSYETSEFGVGNKLMVIVVQM
jgi:hypothetical protein